MPTRFVHIGDFHAAPGPRNADRYRALDQIIREVEERQHLARDLGAWLWPGDLFDAQSTTDDRNALDQRLQRMADHAPVVICYGNHDKPGDLDGFARLHGLWPIVVVDQARCIALECGTGAKATIFVLPYPQKARLVGAGVAAGDVVATAGDVLDPIFMHAGAELEAARGRGDLTLMIGHINVAGSTTSTGQPNIGHEIELNPRHLDRLGDHVYKGLNHIHRPQEIAGAVYAGSVSRMDYGEIEAKRYVVVDLAEDSTFVVGSCPLDVPPMFHVEGRLTRDGFTMAVAPPGFWIGADVRVRYHYLASERTALRPDVIEKAFTGALRLKVEGIADPDRDLRAPAVAAASTLADKLAAYMHAEQLPPAVAEKLTLLERPDDPAALLELVAASIQAIERPAVSEKAMVAA